MYYNRIELEKVSAILPLDQLLPHWKAILPLPSRSYANGRHLRAVSDHLNGLTISSSHMKLQSIAFVILTILL